MRIKYIKGSKKGIIAYVDDKKALRLIKLGQAIITKDMTEFDEETTSKWPHYLATP